MERGKHLKAQIESQVCSSLATINNNFTEIIDKYNRGTQTLDNSTAIRLLRNLTSLLGDLAQVCLYSDIKVYTIDYLKDQISSAINDINKQNKISIGE